MGEFVNLLHTVTDRRIADYHRKLEGKPRLDPLPEEHEEDEDVWGVAGVEADFSGGVDTQAVLDQALGELSEAHRMVVELYLEGYSAKETAEKVNNELGDALDKPMTESNAHKICQPLPRAPRGAAGRGRRLMADVESLFSEFVAEHKAGGAADPRQFLSQVEGARAPGAGGADRRLPGALAGPGLGRGGLRGLARAGLGRADGGRAGR